MDRRTLETTSDGAGSQKISPDNSEEPPGLSAGSSDSEELPDPTGGRYPGDGSTVKASQVELSQIPTNARLRRQILKVARSGLIVRSVTSQQQGGLDLLRSSIVLAIACLALGAGVASADPPSPDNAAGAGTDIRGVVPTQAEAHASAGKGGSGGNLTYHGGRVLLTNRTVAVYWLPSGYTMDSTYQSTINQYFTDVAHDSAASSGNVYSVLKQYYNSSNQFISTNSTFGGPLVDTNPYPSSGCSDNVSQTTICLSDAQLRTELQSLSANNQLGAADPNTTYFIFTAKNVGSCYSSGSCAFSTYCAYHSNVSLGGTTVQYANQPYADTVTNSCDAGYRPNNGDADATINVTSHEHRESINDPLGNAWYDRRGYEGSDKCAWNFGTLLGSNYNQVINGHHYILQQEWSNSGSTCKLHA
jgi:hypothetical protein